MSVIATAAVLLVAILHVGFFVLESVLWTRPSIRVVFELSAEEAESTRVLALNQGFYNLGAALLLLASHFSGHREATLGVLLYLFAMGLVGGFSASKSILLIQSFPAAVAIGVLLFL